MRFSSLPQKPELSPTVNFDCCFVFWLWSGKFTSRQGSTTFVYMILKSKLKGNAKLQKCIFRRTENEGPTLRQAFKSFFFLYWKCKFRHFTSPRGHITYIKVAHLWHRWHLGQGKVAQCRVVARAARQRRHWRECYLHRRCRLKRSIKKKMMPP